jgi:phosphoribosylanthranilate isomerase
MSKVALHPPKIKICGLTQVENAIEVASAGVDAIGLVFYQPSPRFVDISIASEIVRNLPPFVDSVALFVNATKDEIQRVIDTVRPGTLQFHGDEGPDFCASFGLPYLKSLGVTQEINLIEYGLTYSSACGLLLDAPATDVRGGSGRTFDWQLIPDNISKPIVLAGGLDVANVGSAMQAVKPWAVDVSSGVESNQKGYKDIGLVGQFVKEVKDADARRVSNL